MSDNARVIIHTDDPKAALSYLNSECVEARPFSNVAIQVRLDLQQGDRAVAKKDGSVEIVQDAMVGTVSNAEIVEIRD